MATARRKKAKAANPPEYDAFIARGRTLTKVEIHPFNHGLKRLRRVLNNPTRFEAFVKAGVTDIIIIADEIHSRQFRNYFAQTIELKGKNGRKLKKPKVLSHPFVQWVTNRMHVNGITPEKYRGFMSIATPPGDRKPEVRAKFALLRDTLANKEKRRALAAIGPCALSIWDPGDSPEPNGHPAILISNFIPGCMPNSDYSIVPVGVRSDAPNGIWEHS